MASDDAKAQYAKIVFGIAAYATCSSMMLIINKITVTFLPAPSVVLFCQLLTSAVAIKVRSLSVHGVLMYPFTLAASFCLSL
jgi:GDP-mannose transporter